MGNQEMERFLLEFSREKESLLTMVVEQRLMIESLLLRVEKLERATRCSSIVVKVPYMGVGMKIDDTHLCEMEGSLRKIHQKGGKSMSRRQGLIMGIRCAFIATREAIFNTLAAS